MPLHSHAVHSKGRQGDHGVFLKTHATLGKNLTILKVLEDVVEESRIHLPSIIGEHAAGKIRRMCSQSTTAFHHSRYSSDGPHPTLLITMSLCTVHVAVGPIKPFCLEFGQFALRGGLTLLHLEQRDG